VIAGDGLTPRDAKGMVEATTVVVFLGPARGGNGTLLLALPNRGRKLMLVLFDDALEATAQRLEAKTRAVAGCFTPNAVIQPAPPTSRKRSKTFDGSRIQATVERGIDVAVQRHTISRRGSSLSIRRQTMGMHYQSTVAIGHCDPIKALPCRRCS
jgi:hypothetical protein